MKLIISVILSIILTLVLIYFTFFQKLPESIQLEGFISFLNNKSALGGLIGGFIGMMALNLLVIMPFFSNLPGKITELITTKKFSSGPDKVSGRVTHLKNGTEYSIIEVLYNDHKKKFNMPNSLISNNINEGSSVTVFFDPNDIDNSYLDLSNTIKVTKKEITTPSTVFKLLELTPKFDLAPNSYEIIGEIYGGKLQGKKASLVYKLNGNEIKNLTPGKIYPCIISGESTDYSIDIKLN